MPVKEHGLDCFFHRLDTKKCTIDSLPHGHKYETSWTCIVYRLSSNRSLTKTLIVRRATTWSMVTTCGREYRRLLEVQHSEKWTCQLAMEKLVSIKTCNLNSVQNWRLNSAHKYHDEELGRQNCERENWRWLISSLPSVCRASVFNRPKLWR